MSEYALVGECVQMIRCVWYIVYSMVWIGYFVDLGGMLR